MSRKVCIITGANAGIGKQAAIQIRNRGYRVILACRSEERGKAALQEIESLNAEGSAELMLVDMGLRQSIKAFAEKVKSRYEAVDVLIHNAAFFNVTQKEQEKNKEGVESVWAVNHLGPVLLTQLLLDRLKKSEEGRVITVSSQGLVAMPGLKVDLEDPEFDRKKYSVTKAYYQSKRAQVMYTYWLANQLKNTSVTVNCIRVTAVQVDLSRHPGLSAFTKWVYSLKSKMALTPAEMAETYTWLATSDEVRGVSGKYFNEKNKEVKSIRYTYDQGNIDAVMDLTMKYL